MNWKPIVVGVDGSEPSVRAATAAAIIARRAGTTCIPVAAVPDYSRLLMSEGMVVDIDNLAADAVARDCDTIRLSLKGEVPGDVLGAFEVHEGKAPVVLSKAARHLSAGLIVIGSRPHHGLDRLRARIARYLAHSAGVPVLVCSGAAWPGLERILVAVDLSYSSRRTLEVARRWAELFGAQLRVLHVHEPLPPLVSPLGPIMPVEDLFAERLRGSTLWSGIAEADKVVRIGDTVSCIEGEAAEWRADLLVVGTHGRGWADRLLIGMTADQLLSRPALTTLVVPSGRPAADDPLQVGTLPWEEERDEATAAVAARA